MGKTNIIIAFNAVSLAKNPKKGGSPPRLMINITNVILILVLNMVFLSSIVLLVFVKFIKQIADTEIKE